ncbi:insulinase family protein [Vibrio sp. SM6]|uniref:Insulinase family protein n=1 Tax=Vibrio agarilyticus TaxID=2726741 RepID=A0A7X8TNI0_9VIBR|nr:M16 family metallopeptidase [Vibrio agarilyticus]NLS12005.1 insulinase family protein [Vibrio agarilyticus]
MTSKFPLFPVAAAICSGVFLAACQPLSKSVTAQSAITPPVVASATLQERRDIERGTLSNGLRYVLVQNPRPQNRLSLQLVVHAGSLDEADDQQGIAHLVEHMAFNGTKAFPANQLIKRQEALGMAFGRDVNAMTEHYTTSYIMHLPSADTAMVDEGLYMLAQQVSALQFDAQELEKERPVVQEEWRSGLGMRARMGRANRDILLAGSRFAERAPIGDMAIVNTVPVARVKDYWQDWYHPNNMTLLVVGDIERSALESALETHFASLPAQPLPPRHDLALPLDNQTRVETIVDDEITTSVLSLNFRVPSPQPQNEAQLRDALVHGVMMSMLNKRLREQFRVEGEHISTMMAMSQPLATDYRNNRVVVLLTEDAFEPALAQAFAELSRFAAHGFAQVDLDAVRQSRIASEWQNADALQHTTNRRVLMSLFNRLRFQSPLLDPTAHAEVVERLLTSVSLAEINQRFAALIAKQKPLVIAQIHSKSVEKVPTNTVLTDLWQSALTTPPPSLQATQVSRPLLTQSLPDVAIVDYQRHGTDSDLTQKNSNSDSSDVHIWTLANGTQVWFQASDDTPNQLSVRYQGWGGTAHLPVSLGRAAQQLRQMSRFGYGGLNAEQLATLNAPFSNRLITFVSEDQHGFVGSSDRDSLENLLQNAYLQLTQPQIDEAIWQTSKNLMARGIENRLGSPNGQFNTAIDTLRYQHNPLKLPLTHAELDAIAAQDLLTAWHTLFGNANQHQLVIVGDASPEHIIDVAARYLGNLPSQTSQPQYRPITLAPLASGAHQVRLAAGSEPLAATSLLFNQPMAFQQQSDNLTSLASRVVAVRLRNALREDEGGVYSVRFGIRLDRARQQVHGLIGYGHEPERADELRDKAQAVLAQVIEQGVTQQELEQVKAQARQVLTPDAISDRMRLAWLSDSARFGDSMTPRQDYLRWLDAMTLDQVNYFIASVLSTENWIDATLVPSPQPSTVAE